MGHSYSKTETRYEQLHISTAPWPPSTTQQNQSQKFGEKSTAFENFGKRQSHFLEGLNSIVDVNKYNYLVKKELENDRLIGRNSSTLNEYLNVIIRRKQTHSELADFLHAACFSPVVSTFLHAVKNNHFITWPGLTPQLITKHLTKKIAAAKGHLNQE